MKMPVDWNNLQIAQAELDNLLELNLFSTWIIDFSRVFLLRKRQYLRSLLVTEICVFLFGLFLFVPLNLIILRNFKFLTNNTGGFILVLGLALVLVGSLLLVLNYYLYRQAKRFKSLAILLEKISKYNQLINKLKIVTQLQLLDYSDFQANKFKQVQSNEPNIYEDSLNLPGEIITALSLAKASLIKGIELEKNINLNQNIRSDRYQLFASLEEDLLQFISLPQDNYNSEYQQLLTELLQIGLSVHHELTLP